MRGEVDERAPSFSGLELWSVNVVFWGLIYNNSSPGIHECSYSIYVLKEVLYLGGVPLILSADLLRNHFDFLSQNLLSFICPSALNSELVAWSSRQMTTSFQRHSLPSRLHKRLPDPNLSFHPPIGGCICICIWFCICI